MDALVDDLRSTELESLVAIYPEIRRPLRDDPFTFDIEIPVTPENPVTVTFTTPSAAGGPAGPEEDSLRLSHLPCLVLRIALPKGYPEDKPPKVYISTHPQWLSERTLEQLQDEATQLWEEVGRDMVAYTYIDHVQRAADDVFGAATVEGKLLIDAQHKLALLDHDIKAKKEAFEKETFDCGVCLDPQKGSKCHKMLDCDHIFCLRCLQDFYNDAIQEGYLSSVRCLAPNCAKDRSAATAAASSKPGSRPKKPRTYISPSELLQIGLSEDMVKRFVSLMYKTELETDKNTIYCPRPSCNGAARSEKHKKPEGLMLNDVSDTESDGEGENETGEPGRSPKNGQKAFDPSELLAICDDCRFAFCRRCYHSWHGEFTYCTPKLQTGEMTEEEKASLEYLKLHTSPCPTCNAPAQKTHGCNHMICSRCDTHFCYLCSAWLDPTNPYRHYNMQPNGKVTSCYLRLWELEGGDGDDVGQNFAGGLIQHLDQGVLAPPELEPEHGEARNEPAPANQGRMEVAGEGNHAYVVDGPPPPAVAREAPLVLRIMEQRPRPAPLPQQEHLQHDRGRGRGRRGRERGGRAAQPNQRGGGGQHGRGRAAAQPRQAAQEPLPGPGRILPDQRDPVDMLPLNVQGNEILDADQEAWVRRFVEMALIDAEDELDGDSDDDMNFLIP